MGKIILTSSRNEFEYYDEKRRYPHTRVYIEMERAIRRAEQINAFLQGVPYKRYGE